MTFLALLMPALLCAPAQAGETAGLSQAQKKRADMLISVFENSTLELQYGYVEDLHDGRGYTAGRAGFCTGTGDLVQVVRRYVRKVPASPLAAYLPRLTQLAKERSDSTEGLDGFPAAWTAASADELFREAQDDVSDSLYYKPAMKISAGLGLGRDLAKVALYEASIQHGTGSDPDGLQSLIKRASAAAKPPSSGGDEGLWLGAFLKARRESLAHASDPSTAAAWADSVGRADAMLEIYSSGNMDFAGPITIKPYGDAFTIP